MQLGKLGLVLLHDCTGQLAAQLDDDAHFVFNHHQSQISSLQQQLRTHRAAGQANS